MTAALDGGEWSAARPGRTLSPGKNHCIGGWVGPGPVWTGGKSRPHRDSIPDRPIRSQSPYRLSYPVHISTWSSIKLKPTCVSSHAFYWTPIKILNFRKEYNIAHKVVKTQL